MFRERRPMMAPDDGKTIRGQSERGEDPSNAFLRDLRDAKLLAPVGTNEDKFPIRTVDAQNFADYVTQAGAPQGFLERLVDSINYLDRDTFEEDIKGLAERLNGKLGTSGYTMVFQEPLKSGPFIYNKLVAAGLVVATDVVYLDQQSGPLSLAEEKQPVTVDDQAMTGSQVYDIAHSVTSDRPFVVGLLRATKNAETFLSSSVLKLDMVVVGGIKDQKLTKEDYEFLEKITKDQLQDESKIHDASAHIGPHAPIYFTYYMLPDTLAWPLVSGKHPLLKPSNFQREYPTVH